MYEVEFKKNEPVKALYLSISITKYTTSSYKTPYLIKFLCLLEFLR